jgi:hypothetical protein
MRALAAKRYGASGFILPQPPCGQLWVQIPAHRRLRASFRLVAMRDKAYICHNHTGRELGCMPFDSPAAFTFRNVT